MIMVHGKLYVVWFNDNEPNFIGSLSEWDLFKGSLPLPHTIIEVSDKKSIEAHAKDKKPHRNPFFTNAIEFDLWIEAWITHHIETDALDVFNRSGFIHTLRKWLNDKKVPKYEITWTPEWARYWFCAGMFFANPGEFLFKFVYDEEDEQFVGTASEWLNDKKLLPYCAEVASDSEIMEHSSNLHNKCPFPPCHPKWKLWMTQQQESMTQENKKEVSMRETVQEKFMTQAVKAMQAGDCVVLNSDANNKERVVMTVTAIRGEEVSVLYTEKGTLASRSIPRCCLRHAE